MLLTLKEQLGHLGEEEGGKRETKLYLLSNKVKEAPQFLTIPSSHLLILKDIVKTTILIAMKKKKLSFKCRKYIRNKIFVMATAKQL